MLIPYAPTQHYLDPGAPCESGSTPQCWLINGEDWDFFGVPQDRGISCAGDVSEKKMNNSNWYARDIRHAEVATHCLLSFSAH